MKNIHHYFHHLSDSEQGGLPLGRTCHRRRTEAGLVHLLGGLSLDGLAIPVRSPASFFFCLHRRRHPAMHAWRTISSGSEVWGHGWTEPVYIVWRWRVMVYVEPIRKDETIFWDKADISSAPYSAQTGNRWCETLFTIPMATNRDKRVWQCHCYLQSYC